MKVEVNDIKSSLYVRNLGFVLNDTIEMERHVKYICNSSIMK